jgi:hypothetical protein
MLIHIHPVCQVLRGKDTAQAFLIVDDQDAVRPLSCAQLTGLRNSEIFRDCKRRAWLEGCDRAFGGRLLPVVASATLGIGRRDGPLACQLGFDLLADSLQTRKLTCFS